MTTTTIRMPEELKARVSKVVKRADTTTHSFILEAIAEKVGKEEQRIDFNRVADDRFANIAATGKSIPWQAMREYLQGRIEGKKTRRPVPRKLGR
jgi:predicted transcriptional regulator